MSVESSEESDASPTVGQEYPTPNFLIRLRTPKGTTEQINALLEKLENNPSLFRRRFSTPHGRQDFVSGWQELAEELNQFPSGGIKTPKQWMTVWRDCKTRACAKAAKIKRQQEQSGNRTISTAPLTELERRILTLIGSEYTYTAQPIRNRNVNPPKMVPILRTHNSEQYKLSSEQYKLSKQDFMEVAKSNAESMKLLATATQMQAETSKMQAEAAKVQAEAALAFAQAANKIGDALILFGKKHENA